MSTLLPIVLASLAGGVLSVAVAAGTLTLHARWIPHLVAFAVGALLGAVFLELLPHALELADAELVMTTVLAGLLFFFLLEKMVLWRHSHGHEDEEVETLRNEHHGRPGLMILIGAAIHNLCDGIVIAAAFIADSKLGIATTFAIVAHAVPQQVGDFAVLLHSGYSRKRALALNLLTGLATLAGALVAWYALEGMQRALPITLALASASLLYVAVADLIPGLHRHPAVAATAQQLALIVAGLGIIALAHAGLGH